MGGLLIRSVESLFSTAFASPNDGGTDFYGFASKYAGIGDTWDADFLPTGNYNGSGCVRFTYGLTIPEDVGTNVGWVTPSLGHTFTLGESVFFRLRVKWVSGRQSDEWATKVIIWGGGEGGNGRSMFFFGPRQSPHGLDRDINGQYADGDYVAFQPDDYGITLSGNQFTNADYMSGMLEENVSSQPRSAVPNLCLTRAGVTPVGNVSYPWHLATTYNGAAPSGGWYHIQGEARSGTAGNAYYKLWCNHNVYAEHQAVQVLNYEFGNSGSLGMGCLDWGTSWNFGAYSDLPAGGAPFVVDFGGFQVGRTFDPTWYPG